MSITGRTKGDKDQRAIEAAEGSEVLKQGQKVQIQVVEDSANGNQAKQEKQD